jgi:hypothetical protein
MIPTSKPSSWRLRHGPLPWPPLTWPGDVLPGRPVEGVAAAADALEHARLVVVVEGREARQQDEEDHAQRPEVGGAAVAGSQQARGEDLGGHVLGAAADGAQGVLQEALGQPEVRNLDRGVRGGGGQEQVLQLQVSEGREEKRSNGAYQETSCRRTVQVSWGLLT